MKGLKNFSVLLLSMVMLLTFAFPASAATSGSVTSYNSKTDGLDYVVYNRDGKIVERGTIPPNNGIHPNYHWSGITLENGFYTAFLPSNSSARAFYVTNGTPMSFYYSLDKSATMEYQFSKCDYGEENCEYDWRTGTLSGGGGGVLANADETKYYFVGITNASSDPVTLTSVDFEF